MNGTGCRSFVSFQSQTRQATISNRATLFTKKLRLVGPQIKKLPDGSHFLFAGPRGFEPRSTVLETGILPLNYRPVRMSECSVCYSGVIVGEITVLVNVGN